MKKYIRFLIVFLVALGIVGVAKNNPVWAGSPPIVAEQLDSEINQAENSQSDLNIEPGSVRPPDPTIKIKGSGVYNIGGICSLTVEYKIPDLYDRVILRKSAGISLPKDEGRLYLPGCDLSHFKSNKLQNEMGVTDGSWKICFANIPDKNVTIYYLNNFSSTKPAWIPLETTIENGQVCAPAQFTGLYAPAGK